MGEYVFPTRLFNPGTMNVRLMGANVSGGRSLSGIVQNGELSGGGYWVAEFGEISLWTREKVLAWRRLAAAADNGARTILVPLADRIHQPFSNPAYAGADTFGDETWDANGTWAPEGISATLAVGGAQARATEIDIGYSGGTPLVGGEHFSIQYEDIHRLYIVTRVVAQDGSDYTLEIRPPLRADSNGGEPLNFETPRCSMRLDGEMGFSLEILKRGKASVRFIEDFPPLNEFGDSPGDSP